MENKIEQYFNEVKTLKESIQTCIEDRENMRKACFLELNVYKYAASDASRKLTAKFLPKSEAVNVSYFDQLEGLSEDTLKIVNDKIKEIKDHSESRIAIYIQ